MYADWEAYEIEQILDEAAADVNEIILDIIENAVAQTVDYAQEQGIDAFIEDVDVVESGGIYQIWTVSGVTDYSTPERQMLPDLLKGRDHVTIPIQPKKKRVRGDIFSVQQERQARLNEARQALMENDRNGRSIRAGEIAARFRSVLASRGPAVRNDRKVAESTGEPPEFRTASIKQDPNTQWVYPAQDLDMTGFIMNINEDIRRTIEDLVPRLIDSYVEEYK
jgi:hypothetical protein